MHALSIKVQHSKVWLHYCGQVENQSWWQVESLTQAFCSSKIKCRKGHYTIRCLIDPFWQWHILFDAYDNFMKMHLDFFSFTNVNITHRVIWVSSHGMSPPQKNGKKYCHCASLVERYCTLVVARYTCWFNNCLGKFLLMDRLFQRDTRASFRPL